MQLAVGRLRVLVGFSFSASLKPRDEILYDKARAHAEQSLADRYPPRKVRTFGVEKTYPNDWWRNSLLDSRTATLLAEREAVRRTLDGRAGYWYANTNIGIPRWRWHKRRVLAHELCKRNKIAKWW